MSQSAKKQNDNFFNFIFVSVLWYIPYLLVEVSNLEKMKLKFPLKIWWKVWNCRNLGSSHTWVLRFFFLFYFLGSWVQVRMVSIVKDSLYIIPNVIAQKPTKILQVENSSTYCGPFFMVFISKLYVENESLHNLPTTFSIIHLLICTHKKKGFSQISIFQYDILYENPYRV